MLMGPGRPMLDAAAKGAGAAAPEDVAAAAMVVV
jgi:hypothetical protein